MSKFPVTVWVEVGFEIQASYSPGRPAKMPDFRDDVGHPAEPAEWDIEQLSDIVFEIRKWNTEKQKHDSVQCSLFKHIPPQTLVLIRQALAGAIQASELEEVFAEAVADKASEEEL